MPAAESPPASNPTERLLDPLTIAAIALIAGVISDVAHEGIGHGCVSILVGGKPEYLSSMNYGWDSKGLPIWSIRMVSAGGTLANLAVGSLAMVAFRRFDRASAHMRYFFWLLAAMNLFAATGYFVFSGFGGIGDWDNFIAQMRGYVGWRIGLATFGTVAYFFTVYGMMRLLSRLLGAVPASERLKIIHKLCLIPYFLAAALGVLAGMFNPGGGTLLLISGVASSLGGLCGFTWGPQFLRDSSDSIATGEPLELERNWVWIFIAFFVGAFFIAVLGPGIHFSAKR